MEILNLTSVQTHPTIKAVTINALAGGEPEQAVYSARIEDGQLILINTVTTVKRYSAPFASVLINGVTYANPQGCIDALRDIGNFNEGGSVIPTEKYNNAGQIFVAYTGLSRVGFTSFTLYDLPIHTAVATIVASPLTKFPRGSATTYNPAMYIPGATPATTARLRENSIEGQLHTWRILGTFANKSINETGQIIIELFNPDSQFREMKQFTLPQGMTSGNFSVTLLTVADPNSLNTGRGYRLRTSTSFNDNDLNVTINSILRVSSAQENE